MTDLERIYTFVIDTEEAMKIRDGHYRTIRAIQMESDIISRSGLPQFEDEKNKALEENRLMVMQADEAFRVSSRVLLEITGKSEIDDIRYLVTQLKVSLNRAAEAQRDVADTEMLSTIVREGDEEEYKRKLTLAYEANKQNLQDITTFTVGLIPAKYAPFKPNLTR